jgi:hypothetical protein
MTTDVATGYRVRLAADRVSLPGGLVHDTGH